MNFELGLYAPYSSGIVCATCDRACLVPFLLTPGGIYPARMQCNACYDAYALPASLDTPLKLARNDDIWRELYPNYREFPQLEGVSTYRKGGLLIAGPKNTGKTTSVLSICKGFWLAEATFKHFDAYSFDSDCNKRSVGLIRDLSPLQMLFFERIDGFRWDAERERIFYELLRSDRKVFITMDNPTPSWAHHLGISGKDALKHIAEKFMIVKTQGTP